MRIAVISPYTDPARGGITSYTRELVIAYRNLGIETVGYAMEGRSNPCFEVFGASKMEFVVKSTIRILHWKPDVAHGHSHWYTLMPCLILKTIHPRTRVLFTFHTPPVDLDEKLGLFSQVKRAAFRAMTCLCDAVTFVSKDAKDALALPSSVPQGVVYAAPERFTATELPRREDAATKPIILAVTLLTWPKKVAGLLLLLRAFSSITASFPEWRIVIVGDGPLRRQVKEEIAALDLEGKVILKGFVEDVRSEFASAGIFAQISLKEGLPIALLNAMAFGLPVVATSIAGMPEVVQNHVTGYLVEASKEALADALRELLQNAELRRKMGDAAKAWTATELSWEKVALKDLELAGVTRPEAALHFD